MLLELIGNKTPRQWVRAETVRVVQRVLVARLVQDELESLLSDRHVLARAHRAHGCKALARVLRLARDALHDIPLRTAALLNTLCEKLSGKLGR